MQDSLYSTPNVKRINQKTDQLKGGLPPVKLQPLVAHPILTLYYSLNLLARSQKRPAFLVFDPLDLSTFPFRGPGHNSQINYVKQYFDNTYPYCY